MSLKNLLLAKLSEWRPPAGRHLLAVADEATRWTVEVTADRCDDLICLAWDVTARRPAGPVADVAEVQAWADRVVARVNGLPEPLKVVEVDATRHEAQLRSREPGQRGDDLVYHEVCLKGLKEAVVRRFQAPRKGGGHRKQVAFVLTHDALSRLVEDLTTA